MSTKTRSDTITLEVPLVLLTRDRRMTEQNMTCPECSYAKTPAEVLGEKDVEVPGSTPRHEAELRCPNCNYVWYVPTLPGVAMKAGDHWIGKLPSAS